MLPARYTITVHAYIAYMYIHKVWSNLVAADGRARAQSLAVAHTRTHARTHARAHTHTHTHTLIGRG